MKNRGMFERGLDAIRNCASRKANERVNPRFMMKGNYAESRKIGIRRREAILHTEMAM